MEEWRRSWRSWEERFLQDFEYEFLSRSDNDSQRIVLSLRQVPSAKCALKEDWERKKTSRRERTEKRALYATEALTGITPNKPELDCEREKRTFREVERPIGKDASKESETPFTDKAATGGTVWDASIVMARWLERNPALVLGKRCIELGAGVGLVSSVSCCLGAELVVASDGDDVIPLLESNLKRTVQVMSAARLGTGRAFSLSDKLVAEKLCWESPNDLAFVEAKYGFFETILCSDVVYDEQASVALFQVIVRITALAVRSGKDPILLLAQDDHIPHVVESFLTLMDAYFERRNVDYADLDPFYRSDLIKVYVFRANRSAFQKK
jgi:predicted nicotinamide N-methyase